MVCFLRILFFIAEENPKFVFLDSSILKVFDFERFVLSYFLKTFKLDPLEARFFNSTLKLTPLSMLSGLRSVSSDFSKCVSQPLSTLRRF